MSTKRYGIKNVYDAAIERLEFIFDNFPKVYFSVKRIAEQLGMDKDEVLRLKQFVGLGSLFKDREYSKSWE